jgi:hypothetical protein
MSKLYALRQSGAYVEKFIAVLNASLTNRIGGCNEKNDHAGRCRLSLEESPESLRGKAFCCETKRNVNRHKKLSTNKKALQQCKVFLLSGSNF